MNGKNEQIIKGSKLHEKNLVGKVVIMDLVGLDGNAFSLMGAFQKEARKQGWTMKEIKKVLDECMKGSYDDLLMVLMVHTEETDEEVSFE